VRPAPPSAGAGSAAALRRQLARAERRRRIRAFGLVAPLLLFLLVTFALPIAKMLWRSVQDPEVGAILPETTAALRGWDGRDLPGDAAYAALAADLARAREAGNLATAAQRLNYDIPGFRSLLFTTARRLGGADMAGAPPTRESFARIDRRWNDRAIWAAIKRASGPLTDFYLLAAVDRHRDADRAMVRVRSDQAIYVDVLVRTFVIGAAVTALCLALGFPVAHLLATLPPKIGNPLMILVLLPFWTSLLVRTAAWVVLLQEQGLVNNALAALGVIDHPLRLIYNRTGVFIAMTHVLLPFMILPLYSVMRGIPPVYMRAAASLGARPAEAFLRVYLPQTLPGVGAGCLLVFILAIGYYITPALVGGPADQMISYFVAFYTTDTANWGLAAALGVVLLSATLVLYALYNRLVGIERLRLG
jgi:putative spermidine/putrescine transport system permease protein